MAQFPLIGVTTDHVVDPTAPTEDQYCVRFNYVHALQVSGARAILLPCDIGAIPRYLRLCDGLLITGSKPGEIGSPLRQNFEKELITHAVAQQIPTLGICNGMQSMGQIMGATLRDTDPNGAVNHLPHAYPTAFAHEITISANSVLSGFTQTAPVQVNSFHKQCLEDVGSLVTIAHAPDGALEAVMVPNHPFCIGVQWHPEYLLSQFDHALIESFVQACQSPNPTEHSS